jgi:predicted adenine nucleotide alpha hydrolase (AANH) superfamily ATPase
VKLLLHICCAPCSTATIESWRRDGVDITGTFFNPNIHPYVEHQRRYDTLLAYADGIKLPLFGEPQYHIKAWLSQVHDNEDKGPRCRICIGQRMRYTASLAADGGFDAFSTTLLVSPWQEHELIREAGEAAGAEHDTEFAYRDLRPEYRRSIELSKEAGLYRQRYCGCIFSEYEAAQQQSPKS